MATSSIMMDPASETRFHAKCLADDIGNCVVWTGGKSNGYGLFRFERKQRRAHRVAYEHWRGPIPAGLVLDHLCRVRSCVNPWHLRIVTRRDNTLAVGSLNLCKLNADKALCPGGHEYTHQSPDGKRRCRICRAAAENRRYHARKA